MGKLLIDWTAFHQAEMQMQPRRRITRPQVARRCNCGSEYEDRDGQRVHTESCSWNAEVM